MNNGNSRQKSGQDGRLFVATVEWLLGRGGLELDPSTVPLAKGRGESRSTIRCARVA